MNLVFMGTSEFAVPALEKLAASTSHRVMAVVTQPDRPQGRGLEVRSSPVKEAAVAKQMHLYQPENVNDYEFLRELRALSPDVIVVVAYGQKLSNDILSLPRWCCANIHPSLLPRFRGPEPVARAILRGETVGGVCIVKVVEKMDAGPILGVTRVPIPPDATTSDFEATLAPVGADLLAEVLDAIAAQTVIELPQNEREASYAPKFEKNDGRIDWRKPAARVKDFVRALQPFPVAFTFHNRARLAVWKVAVATGARSNQRPGTISTVEKDRVRVACGEGEVALLEVQPENKKRMSAAEWINGFQPKGGGGAGMSTQAEGKYRAAKERLASAPGDLGALKEFSEAARAFGRRPEALDALKAAYAKRATPELYAELRMVCTFPEFQAIPKPPESGAAPATQAGSGAELLPKKPFPLLLDQVVFYPVQDGQSVFILVTCAISMTIGSLFAWAMGGIGIAAALLFYGIVFGYLWTVLHASGMGEKHTRGWPDLTNPEEFGAAVGQYYLTVLFCFAPAIAVLIFQPLGDELTPNVLAAIALGFFGMLYFPMALMLSGFTHSAWEALNFPSGLRSISKMPGDYLICLGFILFAGIVITVGQVLLGTTFAEAPIPVRLVISLVGQTLTVYLMIVQMRTIGLLYFAREKDLGWFQ